MSESKILVGFEVGTAQPVYLPLHHLAIFGMTQLSGKTTALEAFISRSGLRAIAFKTKRGEAGFTKYNLVTPYYKPRADWQFVEGLVNVALGEKVKYEPGMRYGIMKVCRGRKDLKEIQKAAQELARDTKREFMKAVYEKLAAYLEIVIPELEKWVFADKLELTEGVNVMDLSAMRLETQHLVIASTIEYAFSHLDHVVVIVPEAWETLPQSKMTPVKWVAHQFIRKGAAIGNYLWLDSQDIGGIDKTPLRQCDNWLMGRMKEAHEVERILKQLLGMKVPKEEIQTLPLGHFYAAIGNEVRKVYVLPVGVSEWAGKNVAMGVVAPEDIRDRYLKPSQVLEEQDEMYREKYESLLSEFEKLKKRSVELEDLIVKVDLNEVAKLKEANRQLQEEIAKKDEWLDEHGITADTPTQIENLKKQLATFEKLKEALKELLPTPMPTTMPTADVPSEVAVVIEQPSLTVEVRRKPLTLSTDNAQGRIALLYAEGFFDEEERILNAVQKEMERRGWPRDPRLSGFLDEMCSWGFLRKRRTDRWFYKAAMKSTDARSKGLLKEVEV